MHFSKAFSKWAPPTLALLHFSLYPQECRCWCLPLNYLSHKQALDANSLLSSYQEWGIHGKLFNLPCSQYVGFLFLLLSPRQSELDPNPNWDRAGETVGFGVVLYAVIHTACSTERRRFQEASTKTGAGVNFAQNSPMLIKRPVRTSTVWLEKIDP